MDALLAEVRDRLGIDPADGIAIVGADALVRQAVDPSMPLLVLPARLVESDRGIDAGDRDDHHPGARPPYRPPVLPGRHAHGADPLSLLRRLYPGDHPALGVGGPDSSVGTLTATELASTAHLLPPLDDIRNDASPYGLAWLVARLRAPGGCPWDREQDHRSLRPFLLEEAYEVYDALESGVATPEMADELGDLLLQVVLHAQHAAEAGVFDLADVQRAIMTKIVRRHPHVFGDAVAHEASDVIVNWERIKAEERASRREAAGEPSSGEPSSHSVTRDPSMPAAFAGLSRSLPALAYADEMQARAASLGYDWPDLEGVIDKVAEEASELLDAQDDAHRAEEFGDLLFVLVNLGRKLGVDPEAALRGASRKFAGRFARVERIAGEHGMELRALGLDALDDLWQEAKREEADQDVPAAAIRRER